MKLCKIQELTGGEILAKDILTSELKVLLSAGIVDVYKRQALCGLFFHGGL